MNQIQQVMIVLAGLALLPLVIRLLRMVHLLPLALYFFVTLLCFPEWAAENHLLSLGLFAASVLYFLLRWGWKLGKYLRGRKQRIEEYIRNAKPFYKFPEFQHWAER